jgi:hypothetical protein
VFFIGFEANTWRFGLFMSSKCFMILGIEHVI